MNFEQVMKDIGPKEQAALNNIFQPYTSTIDPDTGICNCDDCLKNRNKLKPVDPEDIYIRTFTGGKFHPLDPREDEVNIFDIAHSLSQMCRFTGHTKEFYSVAQHSVLVADQQFLEFPYYTIGALLHDADEAYMADLATPIKYNAKFGKDFKEISERINKKILKFANAKNRYDRFTTKEIDKRMLSTEQSQLMNGATWDPWYPPYDHIKIEPWDSKRAEDEFLKAFVKYRDLK